jgi:hypothetical protein
MIPVCTRRVRDITISICSIEKMDATFLHVPGWLTDKHLLNLKFRTKCIFNISTLDFVV